MCCSAAGLDETTGRARCHGGGAARHAETRVQACPGPGPPRSIRLSASAAAYGARAARHCRPHHACALASAPRSTQRLRQYSLKLLWRNVTRKADNRDYVNLTPAYCIRCIIRPSLRRRFGTSTAVCRPSVTSGEARFCVPATRYQSHTANRAYAAYPRVLPGRRARASTAGRLRGGRGCPVLPPVKGAHGLVTVCRPCRSCMS